MKQLIRLTILFCTCAGLALTAWAGPEPISGGGKEMKQVAPAPPPECNWTGFYIGLNVGGQWGHSEDRDLEDYNFFAHHLWGYDESGVAAGGQIGYNYQFNWVVLGIEGDLGYMDLDGRGVEPGSPGNDTHGETDSDFYTTIRGRLGFAWGHWLFYGTGGGIGVNLRTRVIDNCDIGPCGPDLIHASEENFDWGWTGGGGVEYMIGCHWTAKVEYLRYQLGDEDFSGVDLFGTRFRFKGVGTEGNIVRAGLNYKF
jgi:outer membrane immunogenic protein